MGIGGDRLLGGGGSLATKTPVKTVESYWPYATRLFDCIKRAMPFSAPGSLKDDEIYALVTHILSEGKIIKPTEVRIFDHLCAFGKDVDIMLYIQHHCRANFFRMQ